MRCEEEFDLRAGYYIVGMQGEFEEIVGEGTDHVKRRKGRDYDSLCVSLDRVFGCSLRKNKMFEEGLKRISNTTITFITLNGLLVDIDKPLKALI